jgi:3-isopropylmalate/(R)-2-methylmalate dehydratase small subunit
MGLETDATGVVEGVAVPFAADNVDTDMIIPRQFLKTVAKAGLGAALFHDDRYTEDGRERAAFILNQAAFRHGRILLAGANFACGSAREHACWALRDFGFRVIVAEGYSSFFFSNCFNNELIPVVLPGAVLRELIAQARAGAPATMRVDVARLCLRDATGAEHRFELPAYQRQRLLSGCDEISDSLLEAARVRALEQALRHVEPWRFLAARDGSAHGSAGV